MSLVAVFLPVNRLPREGDTLFHQVYGYGQAISKFNPDKLKEEIWYQSDSIQFGMITIPINGNCFDKRPYKLFLCNNEFQKGELVTNVVTGLSKRFRNMRLLTVNQYVKIIGEISPEATFVKHGDRFLEYELWWYSIEHQHTVFKVLKNNDMDETFESDPDNYIKVCKVKGNCGCFH